MSKIMQQRLLALTVGAFLTFAALYATGFIAQQAAPTHAVTTSR